MAMWLPGQPLVLASKSESRRKILEAARIPVEVRPANIDERAVEAASGRLSPEQAARLLAAEKARAVSAQLPGRLVLGADQTLVLGERRFSKPADRAEAREQLMQLRGQTHRLCSAIALAKDGAVVFDASEDARLTMRKFSPTFLERYLDAAGNAATASVGGYQVEGVGIHLFERIDGDHFTILGLPLTALLDALRQRSAIAE